eukprot:1159240-Pelagomonas_calceolata.AAC.4
MPGSWGPTQEIDLMSYDLILYPPVQRMVFQRVGVAGWLKQDSPVGGVGLCGGSQQGAEAACASAAAAKGGKGSRPSICMRACHGMACTQVVQVHIH